MENMYEKAKSKSQQRLFGMVHAYKKGKLDLDKLDPSLADKIKGIADGQRRKTGDKRRNTKGITKKAAEEYASTKHEELPETMQAEKSILKFRDFVNESDDSDKMDALKGGLAQDLTIEDIADKHDIPLDYLKDIMPKAIEIELEHTDDEDIAARIALDHLYESPVYYDDKIGLPDMENKLEDLDDDNIEKIIKFNDYKNNDDK
jgi:hypothetical protein